MCNDTLMMQKRLVFVEYCDITILLSCDFYALECSMSVLVRSSKLAAQPRDLVDISSWCQSIACSVSTVAVEQLKVYFHTRYHC